MANLCESDKGAICRGCLAVTKCISMVGSEQNENFSQMLEECFSLKFEISDKLCGEASEVIFCKVCIDKLKNSYEFKQQVIVSMRTFEGIMKEEQNAVDLENLVKQEPDDALDDRPLKFESWSPARSFEDDSDCAVQLLANRTRNHKKSKKKLKHKSKHHKSKSLDDNKIENGWATKVEQLDDFTHDFTHETETEIKQPNGKNNKSTQRTREILSMMDQDKLQCKICSKTFLNNRSLKVHINEHYSDFVCEVCGKGFALRTIYQNHFRRHKTGDFTCRHCGETLHSKGQYDTHVAKHRAQKKYICKHCPERFTAFYAREKHMQDAHDIMKKYKCEHCPESFLVKSMLDKHRRRHHLERLRSHPCEVCGKAFFEAMLLKRHMVVHSGQRVHECHLCGKAYPRVRTLRDHMKIHNNVRNHVCSQCGRAFVQSCTLRNHLKTHEREREKGGRSEAVAFRNKGVFEVPLV